MKKNFRVLALILVVLPSVLSNALTIEVRNYWAQKTVLSEKKIWICIGAAQGENKIIETITDSKGQFHVEDSFEGSYLVAVIDASSLVSVPKKLEASNKVERLIFASSMCSHTKNVEDIRNLNLFDLYNNWINSKYADNFFINYIGGYLEASRCNQQELPGENYRHPNNIAKDGFYDYLKPRT